MSLKENILKHMQFIPRPLHTTELYLSMKERGLSMGIKSFVNRLQEAQVEGLVEGKIDPNSKEKIWSLKKYDKSGQGIMF